MHVFGFEVAHGYQILKGFVVAEDKQIATKMILNEDWDDIIDEFDTDNCTEGYEIIDMWQAEE